MKKVKIRMRETVERDKEVVVSIPDDCTLDTIECSLDAARGDLESANDVIYFLSKNGCEVVNHSESFNDSEVEIYYCKILKES